MGCGYRYLCRNCHHESTAYPGVGMMYTAVYRECLAEVAGGKYGAEWQELCRSTPRVALDASTVIYACRTCGFWEEGTDISLYAPNDPPEDRDGARTAQEEEYYMGLWELRETHHLLKRYRRRCARCGKLMHKASDDELKRLPCPVCGSPDQEVDSVLWD